MTAESWDVDQAVTRGPLDEDLEGCCTIDRYGITEDEEIAGEPLSIALDQEEPEYFPSFGSDDQWVLVEDGWGNGDGYAGAADADGPEELAMHLVSP